MGFSSECCEYVLLALVNKDTVLAYGRVEFSKVGNPGRDRGGKKMESGRCQKSLKETDTRTLLIIYRLIEMG